MCLQVTFYSLFVEKKLPRGTFQHPNFFFEMDRGTNFWHLLFFNIIELHDTKKITIALKNEVHE